MTIHFGDNTGWTPIHIAAMNGHLEVVRLLITSTYNPPIQDSIGWTPIHIAAMSGNLERNALIF